MDITITKAGEIFLEKLNKKVESLHLPLIKSLTEEEAITLTKLIKKLKGQ
jgi:hypothetical protein